VEGLARDQRAVAVDGGELVDDRARILAWSETLGDPPERVARLDDDVLHRRGGRAAPGSCEGRAPERGTRLPRHDHDPKREHRDRDASA
jgi:hypothetical protein